MDSVIQETEFTKIFDLRSDGGAGLPPFSAGAHIDVHLPNGLVRAYSLCNAPSETHRYVIAVALDRDSAGGSAWIHENLRPGGSLRISQPRNNFPLDESAPHTVLIAGGIGITPIWCMMQRLIEQGNFWDLYYCARTRKDAAFLTRIAEIDERHRQRVHLHFDHEPGATLLDLAAVLRSAPSGAHFYCCGPSSMLAAFKQAAGDFPPERIHLEYFKANQEAAIAGGFTVILARSGRSVEVPVGKSILQALLDQGIHVPHSCTEGTCGSCETGVIKGIPDHRDSILSEKERMRNDTMMLCCSGCVGTELVLDL